MRRAVRAHGRRSGGAVAQMRKRGECVVSASMPEYTQTRVRVAAAASKTNARWLLGRLSVFLFVLKLDGAVGSKHHTGLLQVGLEEGWGRLLGARFVGIARELLAALDVEVVGRGEHGHARDLAIGEGRDERR